jgi:two-component system alkaline phosphatase synthesis response regulator PhoP
MAQETILIVDDEPHIIEVVRDYLKQSGYQVVTATDGQSALSQARYEHPALVVLDIMLPGSMDGFEVCRRMRRDPALAEIPIVMLTARVELADRLVGLELGADDYIVKPFSPREVVARVKAVLRRVHGPSAPLHLIRMEGLTLDLKRRTVEVDGRSVDLTPTEFDLLAALARDPGRPYKRAQLVEEVYDVSYEGYDRAIDSHIKNLRRKIERDGAEPHYILTVYGVGYKLAED